MNYDILVADINHMSIYDFLKDGETELELLNRANTHKQDQITTWQDHLKKYPCNDFEGYYKKALETEYKVMSYDDYKKLEKESYINQPLTETTEENFNDMLNVLPPLKWCTIDGIEMFCMSEMYTGTYTSQYARHNDKYYSKMVDVTDRRTWINNYL